MSARTVHIPEDLFAQLEAEALRASRSVDDIAVKTIELGLTVSPEPDLPRDVREELSGMEHLSDDQLWNIATRSIDPDTLAVFDMLGERRDAGEITDSGERLLDRLLNDMDLFSLRKANAYALLKRRGKRLPELSTLAPPSR